MEVPVMVVLLCGVLIITIEAGVVTRLRRSPSSDKIANKFRIPHIALVGLVDQPVPTAIGIPQKTLYAPTSYGPPPLPVSYPAPAYPSPSYAPPSPSYMSPMMSYQSSYVPQQTPNQYYQSPMYMPPQTPYQAAQQPLATEPQQEQILPVPKPNGLANATDQVATKDFQMESTDLSLTDLRIDGTSQDKSSWETETSF
ncbi:uncharacterized protein LOC130702382 [Daphnia carinata]|uniref:uncharacterized protein LOC130702382 n=1 Tax=Daphnia carinata TaxID=120202 RepID=UPI00257D4718|nr:uncharacterized protein LOC130702382 [Daphnia carinata]